MEATRDGETWIIGGYDPVSWNSTGAYRDSPAFRPHPGWERVLRDKRLRRWDMRSVCVRITLAAVLAAVIATSASAHAVLVSSTPKDGATVKAAPKQAVLHFNAKIDKKVTKVTLLDAKGHKIALTTPKNGYTAGKPADLIVPLPTLKPGTYRLEYEVMATDGHVTPGLIRFTIAGGKSP